MERAADSVAARGIGCNNICDFCELAGVGKGASAEFCNFDCHFFLLSQYPEVRTSALNCIYLRVIDYYIFSIFCFQW